MANNLEEVLKKYRNKSGSWNFFKAVRELDNSNSGKGEIPYYLVNTSIHLQLTLKLFIKNVTVFCLKLPKNIINLKYMEHLVDFAISIDANCIEANKSSSKENYAQKIKVCKEKALECVCWLESIVDMNPEEFKEECLLLKKNAEEFHKTFSAILNKLN